MRQKVNDKTLHLWKNQGKFAPLLDVREIANRNNIFNDVGLKRQPCMANSDFHKPKHIYYTWKTLIHAAKDPEAIKDCIRRNEHVADESWGERRRPESKAEGQRRKCHSCRNASSGSSFAARCAGSNPATRPMNVENKITPAASVSVTIKK